MTWRDIIKVHPAADAFPTMSEAELQELGEDIKANGLRNPIVLWGPAPQVLIDGRNRLDAMELVGLQTHDKAGLTVRVRLETSKTDPVALVVSLNLKRRHLDEGQRAMVAAKLANLKEGRPPQTPPIDGVSQAEAARLLNVSPKSVERAAVVRREGTPELVSAVERGEIAVSAAAAIAKQPPPEQKRIVEMSPAERRKAVLRSPAEIETPEDNEDEGYRPWEDPHDDKTDEWIMGYCDLRKWHPKKSRNAFKILATSKLLTFEEARDAFGAWYASLPAAEQLQVATSTFAGLSISQQEDVIGRADRVRDAARSLPKSLMVTTEDLAPNGQSGLTPADLIRGVKQLRSDRRRSFFVLCAQAWGNSMQAALTKTAAAAPADMPPPAQSEGVLSS